MEKLDESIFKALEGVKLDDSDKVDQIFSSLPVIFGNKRIQCDSKYFQACALSVYCMMPIMAKMNDDGKSMNFSKWKVFIDDPKPENLEPFVGGSWSATSKFLFFYKPNFFPIWDSRVKKAINKHRAWGSKFKVSGGCEYFFYRDAIDRVSKNHDLVKQIRGDFRGPPDESPIRVIERALFKAGKLVHA
jgi:hypothetical protein